MQVAKHAFDRKIDSYTISFQRTADLVEKERALLSNDLRSLEEQLFSGNLTKPQLAYINKRKHDIKIERSELLTIYDTMRIEYEKNVALLTLGTPNTIKLKNDIS